MDRRQFLKNAACFAAFFSTLTQASEKEVIVDIPKQTLFVKKLDASNELFNVNPYGFYKA